MTEQQPLKTLHSKATMLVLVTVLIVLFVVFVNSYQKRLVGKESIRVSNHAKVISASLWNYDKLTPLDYLSLSIDSNNYREITVRDEYDRVFLRLEGKPLSAFEKLLSSAHLIRTHNLESDIIFEGRHIGNINVTWPSKAVYLYMYIAFCLILLLNGIALYLKLLDAKNFLESRVKQRTTELEAEVTERKKAQEELQLQAQKLSMHVRNTPLAVVEFSTDFTITEWNMAAEEIFEYTRSEALGKNPTDLILPESEQKHVNEIWQNLMKQKGGTRSVNTNQTKSGKLKTCNWYNTTLVDRGGKVIGAASLVLDITEQVEAEKKNKLLQEQLMQAQKMEAVGNMAGGVAHDFNNLLQSISGYTQLLMLELKNSKDAQKKLKGIETSSRRAADLVRQLLTFSRKIESNLAPLNLNREIRHIRAMLDRTIPKMIEIELRLDPELLSIKGDSVQIEQILLNLAINASHAMPEGGALIIETKNVYLDGPFCNSHLGTREGANVMLRVTDTGIGMDAKTVKRVFEPFFTTKETGKGTGLGLASVYGIVQGHKSYIECWSEPGKGTSFTIYFPAIAPQQEVVKSDSTDTTIPVGNETVLLIDDESTIREIGTEMLLNYGYKVLTASSGEEGIDAYGEHRDDIDIVIMDLNMPGMGGFKCMKELKSMDPNCLVLVASGYTPAESIQRASELGAAGFLSKPFQMYTFLKKIRETLDGS